MKNLEFLDQNQIDVMITERDVLTSVNKNLKESLHTVAQALNQNPDCPKLLTLGIELHALIQKVTKALK